MLEVKKTNEGIVLSLSFQLDKEDATELIKDLQAYVDRPTFKGIKESSINWKPYDEAKAQNESKNKLHKEMQRVFVDVLDTEYLETKFATTYNLDAINREVEILRKKLNKQ
jgi:ADP-ribose pyrophosphatase YjhB (NUDIX family)